MTTIQAVQSQFRIGLRSPWAYRGPNLLGLLILGAEVALYTVVWRAIYRGHSGAVHGTDVNVAVAYVVLGLTVSAVLDLWPGESIAERVREGLIGIDLLRPIGLLTRTLAIQAGNVAANVPRAVVGVGIGFALGGLVPAHDVGAAMAFLFSLLLAGIVSQLITLLMSLSSFWTLEVGGIGMLFGVVRMFFSGSVLPLWFMPGWLRAIADVLPFQAATFTPLSVYFGRPHGGLLVALAVQAGWVVVLSVLCGWVWSRARRRVVVQGG